MNFLQYYDITSNASFIYYLRFNFLVHISILLVFKHYKFLKSFKLYKNNCNNYQQKLNFQLLNIYHDAILWVVLFHFQLNIEQQYNLICFVNLVSATILLVVLFLNQQVSLQQCFHFYLNNSDFSFSFQVLFYLMPIIILNYFHFNLMPCNSNSLVH